MANRKIKSIRLRLAGESYASCGDGDSNEDSDEDSGGDSSGNGSSGSIRVVTASEDKNAGVPPIFFEKLQALARVGGLQHDRPALPPPPQSQQQQPQPQQQPQQQRSHVETGGGLGALSSHTPTKNRSTLFSFSFNCWSVSVSYVGKT